MKFYLILRTSRLFDDQPACEVSNEKFIKEATYNGLTLEPHAFEEFYNDKLTLDNFYLRIVKENHHDN